MSFTVGLTDSGRLLLSTEPIKRVSDRKTGGFKQFFTYPKSVCKSPSSGCQIGSNASVDTPEVGTPDPLKKPESTVAMSHPPICKPRVRHWNCPVQITLGSPKRRALRRLTWRLATNRRSRRNRAMASSLPTVAIGCVGRLR